jgi:type IV pilus assembly protein PilA
MSKCRPRQIPGAAPAAGFTLVELMIVVAIITILSTLAMPAYQDRVIRAQVSEGIGLAEFAKQSVSTYYSRNRRMPKDNAAAGLPDGKMIVGNYVSEVKIADGAINITFGNRVNKNAEGKTLTIRPAIVAAAPVVPIAWVCGNASTPDKMTAAGTNGTTLSNTFLPIDCRSEQAAAAPAPSAAPAKAAPPAAKK